MSKTTKRKHVTREALDDYYVPEGDEEIVKIIAGRGNNLHEVECADGKKFLVSMPTKFRKNLWIKRGDFVVINPIKEGNKVLAEIVYVLYNKQIKYLQGERLWPDSFTEKSGIDDHDGTKENDKSRKGDNKYGYSSSSKDDDDDDLFRNPNRKEFIHAEDSETESSDEESEDDEPGNDDDDNVVISGQSTKQVDIAELETEVCNRLKIR